MGKLSSITLFFLFYFIVFRTQTPINSSITYKQAFFLSISGNDSCGFYVYYIGIDDERGPAAMLQHLNLSQFSAFSPLSMRRKDTARNYNSSRQRLSVGIGALCTQMRINFVHIYSLVRITFQLS